MLFGEIIIVSADANPVQFEIIKVSSGENDGNLNIN